MASPPPTLCLITELAAGGTLGQALRPGKLPAPSVRLGWACEVCAAMAYLHEKPMAHLDLKPENVLLSSADHAVATAKVADLRPFPFTRRLTCNPT